MIDRSASTPILELKNISVKYGVIEAIRDVDFQVKKGQIVSLIGSNGAGKTTTLRAISGLVQPSAGEILHCGEKIGGGREGTGW
jgi:branched-chain amino acid transport system ATP-binding protein